MTILLLPLLFTVQVSSPLVSPAPPQRSASDRVVRLDPEPLATIVQVIDLAAVEVAVDSEGRLLLELLAPRPARSAGLWLEGPVGASGWRALTAAGPEPEHPLLLAHDLSAAVVGADRPAGNAELSGLLHARTGALSGVQLALDPASRLERLTVVWMEAPLERLDLAGLPTSEAAATFPKPPVYGRSFWGAAAPTCTYTYCGVTHLAVHHSASTSDYTGSSLSEVAADVKAIQTYHMVSNGWCDIGYNYVISKQGWIFEGRGGGDDVKGAHDGKNCGSMGVCALGYFHPPYNNAPTSALLDAYAELFAWKSDQKGLNPLGSSFYAGLGAVEQTIYGHRDVSSTACPGDTLYTQLPGLRSDVQALLDGGGGPTAGTLKGVLYNANLGTSARIPGGTVALADGSFTTADGLGYYQFPLAAGSYAFAASAPGYTAGGASETVTNGDVWESLGLTPGTVPAHQIAALGPNLVQATFSGDPGSAVLLGYSTEVGIPLVSLSGLGPVWPRLAGIQTLPLDGVPGGGVLTVNLSTPAIPGLVFHTQGLVVSSGSQRLTNGRSWNAP